MIIYLSLKQILLNQIAVLLRKQSSKTNDEPERLAKRLKFLQQALEQIKSYEHNTNFKYVIKHFNIELSDAEQKEMRRLSNLYDDLSGNNAQRTKTGFTTQRSETLFTGAAEEQYDNFYGSDNEMDDEKTPRTMKPPQWIHYRGFAHWLRKQSFIKFKKRNDQEKYKKIWNAMLGLNLITAWDKGRIKANNIIGPYGTNSPYLAIHECGSRDIVKASLLRLSMTQNRIFKFSIEREDAKVSRSRTRRSIDMDNEDDYNQSGYQLTANELMQGRNLFNEVVNKDTLRIVATMLWDTNLANNVLEELLYNPRFSMYGIHAKNLADTIRQEMNLDTTPSYDAEQTPMDDAQIIAAQQQQQQQQHQQQQPKVKDITHGQYEPVGTSNVAQFQLPSPQRPVSMQQQKEIDRKNNNYGSMQNTQGTVNKNNNKPKGGSLFNPQFNAANNMNNNANSTSYNASNSTFSFSKPSNQQHSSQNANKSVSHNNNNNNKMKTDYAAQQQQQSDHARYYQQQQQSQQQQQQQQGYGGYGGYKTTPEPIPEETPEDVNNDGGGPRHKGHSESVVFHDNIRESEIMDSGLHNQLQYHSDSDDGHYGGNDDESVSDDNH